MPIILKSGSFKLQEPSGPVQACNGIALTLHTLPILLQKGAHPSTMNFLGTHLNVFPKIGCK